MPSLIRNKPKTPKQIEPKNSEEICWKERSKKEEETEKEILLFDCKKSDFNASLKPQKESSRAQVACHKSPTKTLTKERRPKNQRRDGEDKVLAWSSRQKTTKTPSTNKPKTQKQKKENNKKTLIEREQQKP